MRVVVALDGSSVAEEVVAKVAPWLRGAKAEADLLTVIDASEIHGTLSGKPDYETTQWGVGEVGSDPAAAVRFPPRVPEILEFDSQALEEVEAERLGFLEGLGSRYLSDVTHRVKAETSEHASQEILRFANEVGADAIAIGTHGRTGLRRLIFGSVAEEVVRHAAVPVFVVPASHASREAPETDVEVSA